jgi:hypothetical protein
MRQKLCLGAVRRKITKLLPRALINRIQCASAPRHKTLGCCLGLWPAVTVSSARAVSVRQNLQFGINALNKSALLGCWAAASIVIHIVKIVSKRKLTLGNVKIIKNQRNYFNIVHI